MITKRPTFLISDVRNKDGQGYQVRWQINPHMKIGASSLELAEAEHTYFVQALESAGADILRVPFVPGAYDSVFIKDNAVIVEEDDTISAFLTRPATLERSTEPNARADRLSAFGIQVVDQSTDFLEGGDVVIEPIQRVACMGYGFRTTFHAKRDLENFLGFEVMPLELIDPYFYHLDTCLNLIHIDGGCIAFACPDAFTPGSWALLNSHPMIDSVEAVSREDALRFGLNWVEVGDTIVIGSKVPELEATLNELGKETCVRPLSQFQLAGGSAACLVAPVYSLAPQISGWNRDSAKEFAAFR